MLLRDDGCNMKEVRSAAWNAKHASFYNVFHALEKKGLAIKTKDSQMIATANARNAGAAPVKA